jgi:hypothetical protein
VLLSVCVEMIIARFDPAELAGFGQIVFLVRGWRHGLALIARIDELYLMMTLSADRWVDIGQTLEAR